MSNTEFQLRNKQLVQALNARPDTALQVLASELYEQTTGNTLYRETDPINGEDYMYKSGENECMASLRVHPEVVSFFNWRDGMITSSIDAELRLCISTSNANDILSTRFEEFQADA